MKKFRNEMQVVPVGGTQNALGADMIMHRQMGTP